MDHFNKQNDLYSKEKKDTLYFQPGGNLWQCFKIETIQRRLAWSLRKDDTKYREVLQFFFLN